METKEDFEKMIENRLREGLNGINTLFLQLISRMIKIHMDERIVNILGLEEVPQDESGKAMWVNGIKQEGKRKCFLTRDNLSDEGRDECLTGEFLFPEEKWPKVQVWLKAKAIEEFEKRKEDK